MFTVNICGWAFRDNNGKISKFKTLDDAQGFAECCKVCKIYPSNADAYTFSDGIFEYDFNGNILYQDSFIYDDTWHPPTKENEINFIPILRGGYRILSGQN